MVRLPVRRQPTSDLRPLMPQQERALGWVRRSKLDHLAIFMEMRLGKTLTSIRIITTVWELQEPCLVVAPVTVLEAWEKELQLEKEAYVIAQGLSKKKRIEAVESAAFSGERKWCLINYDALRSYPEIAEMPWGAVLMDESTVIKNSQAKITQLACTGFGRVKHRMILSGLPSPEGDINLYSQFVFMRRSFLGHNHFYRFRARYFEPSDGWGGWKPREGCAELIKEEVYKYAFVLRRQDAGLHGKKIRETRTIEMHKEQKKVYKLAEKEFSVWLDRGDEEVLKDTSHVVVQRTWLARIAGGCDAEGRYVWDNKVAELLKLLKGELKGQPIVVWFRFNAEIKAVESALNKEAIPCKALIGESSRDERKAAMNWFRTSREDSRVLLCQIKLAKYGVDVSVSDTAIYYSMTYSTEEIAQSEDRIFHPMKKVPLLYIYLVSKKTVDEDVLEATNDKVTTAKMFMMLDSGIRRRGQE